MFARERENSGYSGYKKGVSCQGRRGPPGARSAGSGGRRWRRRQGRQGRRPPGVQGRQGRGLPGAKVARGEGRQGRRPSLPRITRAPSSEARKQRSTPGAKVASSKASLPRPRQHRSLWMPHKLRLCTRRRRVGTTPGPLYQHQRSRTSTNPLPGFLMPPRYILYRLP